MTRTDPLDERAYIFWSQNHPPQQAIISSHGGYVFERMPFTTPVLLRYYQGHGQLAHGSQLEDILTLIATADAALLPQSPRPREFPAGSLSRDYVLTKFQTEDGESYDDIEGHVQTYNGIIGVLGLHPQAGVPYLMRLSPRLRRPLLGIPTGSVGHVAIVTVRHRPTKAAVHLSDLVAAICAAAPRIHTIHCSFCLALPGPLGGPAAPSGHPVGTPKFLIVGDLHESLIGKYCTVTVTAKDPGGGQDGYVRFAFPPVARVGKKMSRQITFEEAVLDWAVAEMNSDTRDWKGAEPWRQKFAVNGLAAFSDHEKQRLVDVLLTDREPLFTWAALTRERTYRRATYGVEMLESIKVIPHMDQPPATTIAEFTRRVMEDRRINVGLHDGIQSMKAQLDAGTPPYGLPFVVHRMDGFFLVEGNKRVMLRLWTGSKAPMEVIEVT